MDKNCIIKYLKEYRANKKITQDDFADELGYSVKSVAKWEQGISIPPIEVLAYLSQKLDKTINEIIGLKEQNKSVFEETFDLLIKDFVKDGIVVKEYDEKITIDEFVSDIITSLYHKVCKFYVEYDKPIDCQIKFDDIMGKSAQYKKILHFWEEKKYIEVNNTTFKCSKELLKECINENITMFLSVKKDLEKDIELYKKDKNLYAKELYLHDLDDIDYYNDWILKCRKYRNNYLD